MTNHIEPTADEIERVARGICLSYGADPDDGADLIDICGPNNESLLNWHLYEEQARAAILAMDRRVEPRADLADRLRDLALKARRVQDEDVLCEAANALEFPARTSPPVNPTTKALDDALALAIEKALRPYLTSGAVWGITPDHCFTEKMLGPEVPWKICEALRNEITGIRALVPRNEGIEEAIRSLPHRRNTNDQPY
jgi:hypothetical protein